MKDIFKRLNQMSLRNRLIIAVIICIFLPWIGTYFVSNYVTKDALEERAVKQSRDSLRVIEKSITNIFDDVMYVSNYIQFDTNFNKIMKSHQAIDPSSSRKSQEVALSYIDISNSLASITDLLSPTYITIIFENDLYYMNYSTSDHHPLDFQQMDWFEDLEHLNYYQTKWIGVHPTYITSEQHRDPYLISIGRNLQQSNNKNAYLIISIKESQIRTLLENFQEDSNVTYYLTDQEGTVFSSLNENRIGEQLDYDVSSDAHQIVDYNSQDHLLVSYPVPYSDWRLVSLVPYQQTIGNINEVTRTTILIQGGLLLLFLILLIILVREITKPITELNSVTKAVEDGDLTRRAIVSGNNDVAELGHSFNDMLDTIEEMIEQVKKQEEEKRSAELEMLQAQINPHFLFNALNAIRLHIKMNGDKDSANLIHALSSLLRMSINRDNAFISLKEELEIVEDYMQLMNFRHKHEIKIAIFVEDNLKEIKVPRFFLQPLIENAVIHGYEHKKGSIVISGYVENDQYLLLQVEDDGSGMSETKLNELKTKVYNKEASINRKNSQSFSGIGIRNVYQRMKMIYGTDFSMRIDSTDGKGTRYTFYIPIQEG